MTYARRISDRYGSNKWQMQQTMGPHERLEAFMFSNLDGFYRPMGTSEDVTLGPRYHKREKNKKYASVTQRDGSEKG